jgi:hypothetical protein
VVDFILLHLQSTERMCVAIRGPHMFVIIAMVEEIKWM